ncbi:DUF4232 domain-containing protein [Streptomyces globisporus]|uniref:DUF4232 domain-containing protein n=1 Tax=Streptomyces globisporus TaxID=1908 RepID=UPI0005C955F0|nr:DUF4232 domain-containing protein [Streptomyces globisporus]PPA44131.1 hypothetical protein BF14_033530 [Streptomyces griseus]RAN21350.1 hypothetical protein A3838_32815 [Streptomyces badius]AWL90210.1 DUF4232 domain-containing protein [Streptomyces globisporus]RAN29290.1 hypothetical protein A3800_32840 [Streptomyces badius]WSV94010.1 DUF4232 domain-containing protein [Streptomyces globisporus]
MSVWGKHQVRRPSALVALAAVGALSLSACGAEKEGADAEPASAERTAPQAASSTAPDATEQSDGSGASGTADPGGEEAATQGRGGDCTTDMLKAAMSASGQEMNSKYFDLTLTNTGEGPCTLKGYAGLSLTDASGARIGEPAERSQDGSGGGLLKVAPGKAVHAVVKTPGKDVTDGDCWKKPAKIKVYPPDNTAALSAEAPAALQVCGDTFTVGPFAAEAP